MVIDEEDTLSLAKERRGCVQGVAKFGLSCHVSDEWVSAHHREVKFTRIEYGNHRNTNCDGLEGRGTTCTKDDDLSLLDEIATTCSGQPDTVAVDRERIDVDERMRLEGDRSTFRSSHDPIEIPLSARNLKLAKNEDSISLSRGLILYL